MQKSAFEKILADKLGCSRQAASDIVEEVFNAINDVLADGDEIAFPGFGRFTVTHKKERTGRHPQSGKEIKIPARTVPVFRPATALKEATAKVKKNK